MRIVLLPVTLFGWALIAGALLLFGDAAIAAVFSLAVLVAGFEAIHALHVGVERIGRYVQVYYEAGSDGPRWETTAMAVGPALPGGGIDPLFTVGVHQRHPRQPDSRPLADRRHLDLVLIDACCTSPSSSGWSAPAAPRHGSGPSNSRASAPSIHSPGRWTPTNKVQRVEDDPN